VFRHAAPLIIYTGMAIATQRVVIHLPSHLLWVIYIATIHVGLENSYIKTAHVLLIAMVRLLRELGTENLFVTGLAIIQITIMVMAVASQGVLDFLPHQAEE
jgi:hypothetical protein